MDRTARLEMRLTKQEKRVIHAAATLAGITTSAWLRMVALREARRGQVA